MQRGSPRSRRHKIGTHQRIALLLDSFDPAYQASLVRYVREACARRGLDLVVFPAGVIHGVMFSAPQRNRIFDLVSNARFDGVVLLSGTMTREVDIEAAAEYCKRLRPLPITSIGSSLAGIPSYLIDNGSGMRELVRHLVQEHGYTRFAFVAGPATNQEARERFTAFQQELEANGIAPDHAEVVHGDFMPASGQHAVDELLQHSAPPQVMVAANDAMAMGVQEALSKYPHEIAHRIAVCGFDNVMEADFCSPPLTTVEQPLERLAKAAVAGIVAQLEGQPCAEVTRFDTHPVYRRSCGCDATQAAAPEMQRRKASRGNSVLEFMRRRDEILAQLATAGGEMYRNVPSWSERLLDSFMDQIRDRPGVDFLAQVRSLLQHTVAVGHGETGRFQNVLSALRRHCLPCVAGDLTQYARAEDLLQSARTLAGEAVLRGQAKRLLNADHQFMITNYVGTRLGEAENEAQLADALCLAARELDIRRIVAVELVFPGGASSKGPTPARDAAMGRVLCCAEAHRPYAVEDVDRTPFPITDLVPVDAWLRGDVRNWVTLPLFHRNQALGYLLAELCLWDGKPYEALRVHFSAALWALRRG